MAVSAPPPPLLIIKISVPVCTACSPLLADVSPNASSDRGADHFKKQAEFQMSKKKKKQQSESKAV